MKLNKTVILSGIVREVENKSYKSHTAISGEKSYQRVCLEVMGESVMDHEFFYFTNWNRNKINVGDVGHFMLMIKNRRITSKQAFVIKDGNHIPFSYVGHDLRLKHYWKETSALLNNLAINYKDWKPLTSDASSEEGTDWESVFEDEQQ